MRITLDFKIFNEEVSSIEIFEDRLGASSLVFKDGPSRSHHNRKL